MRHGVATIQIFCQRDIPVLLLTGGSCIEAGMGIAVPTMGPRQVTHSAPLPQRSLSCTALLFFLVSLEQ